MEAIILAGGFGTRLQSVVSSVPKPMAPVQNRPFLEYILDYLKKYDITDVVISVGYLHDVIINHFGHSYSNINITYAIEDHPLGTGGGIKFAASKLNEDVAVVLNGDSFFDINLHKLFSFYSNNNADIVLSLKYMRNVSRYGCVDLDDMNRVVDFHEKGQIVENGFINGGIYIFNREILDECSDVFSFEKDFLEKKSSLKIMGIPFNDSFIDIGIPEDYQKIQTWHLN